MATGLCMARTSCRTAEFIQSWRRKPRMEQVSYGSGLKAGWHVSKMENGPSSKKVHSFQAISLLKFSKQLAQMPREHSGLLLRMASPVLSQVGGASSARKRAFRVRIFH